jgi:phosphoribosylglycinamide formyltransferase-1
MDHGPIILQESFKLTERETLESLTKRIHKAEHKILPKAIRLFVEGKLKIKGRKVRIMERPPKRKQATAANG